MSQERMNMSTYQKTALGTTMAGLGMQSCSTMLLSYVLTSIIADFAISSTAGGAISTITNLGMLAGGIIYTVGGVIYALKLPIFNSRHKYFGSHEIFHLFVMAGSACHFVVMYAFVL